MGFTVRDESVGLRSDTVDAHERNIMKRVSTAAGGFAGFLYGLLAIFLVYRDAPPGLQTFIVVGVATTGASVGWLAGLVASSSLKKRRIEP